MSQINTDLETLKTARDNMKTALEGKGQTVTKDIRTYANAIANISTGGGGDVKLFVNEQAMHADTSPSMGDLALVYGDSTGPWTQSTRASTLIFPRTVTLASAYTGSIYSNFRAVDPNEMFYGDVQLSSSNFYFRDMHGGVYYTSSDGITYTREGGEDTYDIGFDIYCPYHWDDILGNFIQTGSKYFGGVFEYGTQPDKSVLPIYTPVANTTTSTGELTLSDTLPVSTFNGFVQAIETYTSASYSEMNLYMTSSKDKIVGYGYINDNSLYSMSEYITKYNNNWYLTGYSHETATAKRYEYDIQTGVVTDSNWVTAMSIPVYSSQTQPQMLLQETYVLPTVGRNNGAISSLNYIYVSYCENTANPLHISPNFNTRVTPTYSDKTDYWTAKTQLTLDDANQLLPGKIGYGNNGIITGDNTVFGKIDIIDLISTSLNTDDYSKGIHIISSNKEIEGKSLNNKTTINDNYYKSNVIQFRKLFNFNTSDICCYNFARDYLVILRTSNSNIEVYDLTGTLVLTLTTDVDTSTARYLRIDDIDAGKDGTICYMIRYSDSTVTTVGILDITNDTGTCITFTNPARSYNHSFDVDGHIYTLSGSYTSSNAGVYKDGVLVKSDTNIGILSDESIRFFVNKNYIYWFSSGGYVFAYDITNNNVIKNTISSYTGMDSFVLYNSRTSDAYLIWWKIPETGKFTYVVTKFNNGGITEVFSSKTITIPSQITSPLYSTNSYTFPYYYNTVSTKIYSNMNFVVGISLNVSNGDLELNYFGNNISSENLHCYIDTIKYLMIKDDKVYECKLRYDYEITNTNTDYSLVNDCKVSQFKPFGGSQWYSYLILHNSL